ncbi:HlyD family type I secretion periplasmic adaptor subunit [Alsobacter sp. SYSU M60028]|uniref:Membrane fusion protein (MFP) family protein n=1 Tax=Alsobacter ponti TaxID=2962936 RepID=A0ABT1LGW1_9HYPH|nr:HlyD family type I secretion periplasmic adaptor subunit [Alsobacter ponti]MCP8940191.1 HlyD family type I secretion periplasmic adaptor subunit [Alsobacter ponti]
MLKKPNESAITIPSLSAGIARRASAAMIYTIAASLAAFLVWAAWTDLDKVTHGAGRVVPQMQNQVVQHLEGGIVSEILVKEGDRVQRGEPLMRIDNSFARSELAQASIELKAKYIRLARLEAESKGLQRPEWPATYIKDLPGIAERETALFETRQKTMHAQEQILDDQLRQKELELSEFRSRLINTQAERELVQKRVANLRRLAALGAVSQNELLDNERTLQQMDARMSDLGHDIPRTDSALNEIRNRRAEAALRFRGDADKERADTEVQIAKLNESISAMQDRRIRSEVVAPMTGVINKLFVNTIGGVVKSGEPLAQLVPFDSSVAVEARLSPTDRAQVWPGLPAIVKVSAYDFSIYGGLPGKVVEISPDVLQDEKGQPYFRVRLEADATAFGPDKPVVPGMLAEINIISGHQTVLSALLRPVRRVQEMALR